MTEETQVAELMKPRYLVIADYPESCLEVGEIVTVGENSEFMEPVEWWNKYPHLFRPLYWWEHRRESEMPMYLKQTEMVDSFRNPVPDQYFKVKAHFKSGSGDWRHDSYKIFTPEDYWAKSVGYEGLLPATSSEYTAYINSKKESNG